MRIIIEFDQQTGQPAVSTAQAAAITSVQATAMCGGAALEDGAVSIVSDSQGLGGVRGGVAQVLSGGAAFEDGGAVGGGSGSAITGSASIQQDGGAAPQFL